MVWSIVGRFTLLLIFSCFCHGVFATGENYLDAGKLVMEGRKQFKELIEQNEQNRRDGCADDNVYIFSLTSNDDWSTYIKTHTDAPEFADPYIYQLNDKLKQFNEDPDLSNFGVYVCLVSELEVRVAYDYANFGVTKVPDIIDMYRQHEKDHGDGFGGEWSAVNMEQLREEYRDIIEKVYQGVDINLGTNNTGYQNYQNRTDRALLTNTAIKLIVNNKEDEKLVKYRRIYGGRVANYFNTHQAEILKYQTAMLQQRPSIPFYNTVLSYLEFAEGGLHDPANRKLNSHSFFQNDLASAAGSATNNTYTAGEITNPQTYLFDFTGTFGNDISQINNDSLNLLLAGQLIKSTTKCRVYITDKDVPQSTISVIEGLDLTQSQFQNTLVLWIHINQLGTVSSNIRMSPDLLADIEFMMNSQRLDELVRIGLDHNGGGGNIGKEMLTKLAEVIYVASEFMVSVLDSVKVPEKYYDVAHPDYSPTFKRVFMFIMPTMHLMDIVAQELFTEFPALQQGASNVKPSDIQFAVFCGLWNGLIDEIKGIFEVTAMVGYWVDDGKKAEMDKMFDVIGKNGLMSTMKQGLISSHTGTPCKIAHQIGVDIIVAVSIIVPFTKAGALSKVRKVLNVIDELNPLTQVFKGAGLVLSKTTSGLVEITKAGVKLAEFSKGKLLVFQAHMYNGLQGIVQSVEQIPVPQVVMVATSGAMETVPMVIMKVVDGSGNTSKMFGKAADDAIAASIKLALKSNFDLKKIFNSTDLADKVAQKISVLPLADQLTQNAALKNAILNIASDELKVKFFSDLADIGKNAGASAGSVWFGKHLNEFVSKPTLVEAWEAIAEKATYRKNIEALQDADAILQGAGLGIDADILKNITKAQNNAKAGGPVYSSLLKNIRYAVENLAGATNVDKLVAALQRTNFNSAPHVGANWTLEYLRKFGNAIDPQDITFEDYFPIGGGRYVDMLVDDGINPRMFYEFKSVKNIPPTDFVNQFLKDLGNPAVLNVGQIKWIFESRKLTSGLDEDLFIDALDAATIDPAIFGKFVPGNPTKAGLLNHIRSNFNTIFELK